MRQSLVLSTLALAPTASAGPLMTRFLPFWRRQTTTASLDCTSNSPTGIQAQCYIDLDIPSYINAWVAANGSAAGCDVLGFAQCYLQFNGYTGLTCDDITSNTCPPFPTADPSDYDSPQQFYTLWNIYTVYQLFNSWSTALFDGSSLAGNTIDAIVAAVSPPTDANTSHSIIPSLIASSLTFLASFLVFAPLALPAAAAATAVTSFVVGNVAVSFSMTAALMGYFAGGGSSDARFITLAAVGSSLSDIVIEFQQSLAAGIAEIQGNHTIFLSLTADGHLSTRLKSGTIAQTVDLFRNLQLYILSASLSANGIVVAKSTGVNALDLAAQYGTFDCPGLGPAGNCYQYWVDQEAGNTYALHNPHKWEGNDYTATLDAIYAGGWANLSEIFEIESCQNAAPAFDPATLSMSCLASHKLCEYEYQSTIVAARQANKQWKNCDNDEDWGTLCGTFSSGLEVPDSYLGPLLRDSRAFCRP